MNETEFSSAKLRALLRKATPGPWFVSSPFEDENEMLSVTVGPHESESPHYEDTIAEFWGVNHGAPENAELIAYLVTHAEFLLKAASQMEKPRKASPDDAAKRILKGAEPDTLENDAKIVARAYRRLKKG